MHPYRASLASLTAAVGPVIVPRFQHGRRHAANADGLCQCHLVARPGLHFKPEGLRLIFSNWTHSETPATPVDPRRALSPAPAVLYNLTWKGEVLLFALLMQSAPQSTHLGFYVIILPLVAVLGFAVYLLIRSYRAARRGRYRHLDDPRPAIGGLVGGLVGAVVGCLLGTSPLLSFGDVLERGANLQGISALLRPAAEAASNWMIAGACGTRVT
jgi:hypothetical protein